MLWSVQRIWLYLGYFRHVLMSVITTCMLTPLQGLHTFQLLLSRVSDNRSMNNAANRIEHGDVTCKRCAPLKIVVSHSFPFSFPFILLKMNIHVAY
jgi:hypothetical protein